MTIKELKNNKEYYFECDITKKRVLKEIADTDCFDEWGCAFISVGDELGVEYNLCVDDGENCSAIYKLNYDEESGYIETDASTFIHYEIDFNNPKWKKELEDAMCEALIKFFEL